MLPELSSMSRTQDLINQIKQMTVEIHDIKTRNKIKMDSSTRTNIQEETTNVHNRIRNGPLQTSHEKHDEDDIHYVHSIRSVHLVPDNMNNLEHYAPTQCPVPEESTASSPPPLAIHPSLPNRRTPSSSPSRKRPESMSPNDPESPGNEGGNIDDSCDSPSTTKTNDDCDGSVGVAGVPCKKGGVRATLRRDHSRKRLVTTSH